MDSDLYQVSAGLSGLVSADELILERNIDMAANAQRRANLVTLSGSVLQGMTVNPNFAGWPVKSKAHYAVDLAEAVLSLIEERTK